MIFNYFPSHLLLTFKERTTIFLPGHPSPATSILLRPFRHNTYLPLRNLMCFL